MISYCNMLISLTFLFQAQMGSLSLTGHLYWGALHMTLISDLIFLAMSLSRCANKSRDPSSNSISCCCFTPVRCTDISGSRGSRGCLLPVSVVFMAPPIQSAGIISVVSYGPMNHPHPACRFTSSSYAFIRHIFILLPQEEVMGKGDTSG